MITLTHDGISYDCEKAVKCTNDKYIKLYDANCNEIASFHDISDFSEYTITGGVFTSPAFCGVPIQLSSYSIGGDYILEESWELQPEGNYVYTISNDLISGNTATCNILIMFNSAHEFEYDATQGDGYINLFVNAPIEVEIKSIIIMRV